MIDSVPAVKRAKACQIVDTVVVQQDFVVTWDQLVSAFDWFRLGILGAKDAGNCLLLEPFPHVAFVGAGPMGEHFGVEGSSCRAA